MRDALPLIREGGIDVVVIDAYDPRVGVVELARSIEALPDAPPIVLSRARRTRPRSPRGSAPPTFLPKPCEPSEVVAAVGHAARRGCARSKSSRTSRRVRPALGKPAHVAHVARGAIVRAVNDDRRPHRRADLRIEIAPRTILYVAARDRRGSGSRSSCWTVLIVADRRARSWSARSIRWSRGSSAAGSGAAARSC